MLWQNNVINVWTANEEQLEMIGQLKTKNYSDADILNFFASAYTDTNGTFKDLGLWLTIFQDNTPIHSTIKSEDEI